MRWRRRDPEPTLDEKLASADGRLHFLEAVALGMRERAAVLEVVDAASSMQDARARLAERFGLDEEQAAAILDAQLRRFVPAEVAKLEAELRSYRELRERYLREGAQPR